MQVSTQVTTYVTCAFIKRALDKIVRDKGLRSDRGDRSALYRGLYIVHLGMFL